MKQSQTSQYLRGLYGQKQKSQKLLIHNLRSQSTIEMIASLGGLKNYLYNQCRMTKSAIKPKAVIIVPEQKIQKVQKVQRKNRKDALPQKIIKIQQIKQQKQNKQKNQKKQEDLSQYEKCIQTVDKQLKKVQKYNDMVNQEINFEHKKAKQCFQRNMINPNSSFSSDCLTYYERILNSSVQKFLQEVKRQKINIEL